MRFRQLVPPGTRIDFVRHFRLVAALSIALLFASAIAVPVRGVRLGIDFAGGYQIVPAVAADRLIGVGEIRSVLAASGFEDADIAQEGPSESNVFQIRFPAASSSDADDAARIVAAAIEAATDAPVTIRKADFVGPRIGAELRSEALFSLALAFALIFVYVAVRFAPAYAPGAIVALIHDVAMTAGLFVLFGWEFDMNVLAALLTIIGYSINDTIVIYDRIRELRGKSRTLPTPEMINVALNQTLSRTLLTSGTTLMAVLALLFFGGSELRSYSVAMTIGIFVGTASSIYVATPILLAIERWAARRAGSLRKTPSSVPGSDRGARMPRQIMNPQNPGSAGESIPAEPRLSRAADSSEGLWTSSPTVESRIGTSSSIWRSHGPRDDRSPRANSARERSRDGFSVPLSEVRRMQPKIIARIDPSQPQSVPPGERRRVDDPRPIVHRPDGSSARPPVAIDVPFAVAITLTLVIATAVGIALVGARASSAAEEETAAADAAFSAQRDANRASQSAQEEVENLDDEAQALLSRYRSIVTENASYDAYSAQLEQSIASQDAELDRIQREMARAGDTARDVLPLTSRLIDDLEAFVSLDAPFHVEERRERIAGLRSLLSRADVSLSEKYRRVIEAYLIELEFGRTMETYPGILATDGDPLTVDYLRIGRVALLYQTPDGGRTGYWDGDAKRWIEDAEYAQAFRKGARVASKLDAPDLVIAPVSAPKEM